MMIATALTITQIRDLYARMLLTRIVDDYAWKMHREGRIDFVASCRGHEAAQVGSAACITVGKDFTLPYYRDLGVVLTIGMTPYEVFRTYLQTHVPKTLSSPSGPHTQTRQPALLHWGYQKHNTITGPALTSTQILHAAGIAFACKLRKEQAVTVAYCSDGTTSEPDFLAGVRFAAEHRLPIIFVCEQDCSQPTRDILSATPCIQPLPPGLSYQCIDGSDIETVYNTMNHALEQARTGRGPTLLAMCIRRSVPTSMLDATHILEQAEENYDPLMRCQRLLQEQNAWDRQWASQLVSHFTSEVERALHDALRDTPSIE